MGSEHYKFVDEDNRKDMELFYELVLKPEDTYEIISTSLSVREKLLTKKERILFPRRKYSMCQRRSVYEGTFVKFLKSIRSYETHKEYMTSDVDGETTPPQEAIRVYVNINRTDGRKIPPILVEELCNSGFSVAYISEYEKEIAIKNMIRLCIKGGDTIIQKERDVKLWVDYEIDLQGYDQDMERLYKDTHEICSDYMQIGNFMMVSSPNGVHIMVRKGAFTCNPSFMMHDISKLPYNFDEVQRNKNDMIILPGTMAYNKEKKHVPIRIINKEDFLK